MRAHIQARQAGRASDLVSRMAGVIRTRLPAAVTALDVGAQSGDLTRELALATGLRFQGAEPDASARSRAPATLSIHAGSAESLPFQDSSFDVVTLISVFEHISPERRTDSLREIHRVLRPGGILAGQMPNMNFPIEVHSCLPGQSFLPRRIGDWYVRRFSPMPWRELGCTWYRATPGVLLDAGVRAGFISLDIWGANYPKELLPPPFRSFHGILRFIPSGYDFCFVA